MKKVLCMLLCVCVMISILPATLVLAEAGIIEKLTVTVPIPVANQKPNLSGVSIAETDEVEIVSVEPSPKSADRRRRLYRK